MGRVTLMEILAMCIGVDDKMGTSTGRVTPMVALAMCIRVWVI